MERIKFLDEFKPVQPIERLRKIASGLFHFLPDQPLASHGDHFVNTGAGPALDEALNVQE